jgi:hypothetical protein
MNRNLLKTSLINALGTVAYVAIVATVMTNAQRIFGQMKSVIGPIAFLLLFVTSAAITASLVLGRPLMLYLDGQKQEAVKLFGLTVGWLALFTFAALILNLR